MEKYKKLLVVLLCVAVLISAVPKSAVYADGMTAAMIGSIAYSIMGASGISFSAGSATAAGMGSFMTNQIESYVNSRGGSLTSVFGTEMARLTAGKLVAGYQIYNGVLGFVDWLKEKYGLSNSGSALTDGEFEGEFLPYENKSTETITGNGIECKGNNEVTIAGEKAYMGMSVYNGGAKVGNLTYITGWYFTGDYEVSYDGQIVCVYFDCVDGSYYPKDKKRYLNVATIELNNSLSWSVPENWGEPAPLPSGKQWEGDFSGSPGFADPPTDLPDFLSRVPAAVAENQLVVYEEITDAGNGDNPPPSPSPSPTQRPDPEPVPQITIAQKIAAILGEIMGLIGLTGDTPLTEEQQKQIADTAQNIEDSVKDVTQNITDTITQQRTETSYDIQDQTQTITQGQQQIKDAIQDQTQTITDTLPDIKDAIQDQTQTITDTLPDIKDAIQDQTQTITDTLPDIKDAIQDQTQTITDTLPDIKDAIQDQTQTITDTLPDIKDAIQDQTQDITDIKDAIEDATQVPTDFEPQKHVLPRGVFPFCIPFDLHDIIVALDAAPVTPEVHIPFRVPTIMGMNFGLDYTFDLDLHDFDGLAQVLRTLEFIAFGVGLLFVTGKVIKW